jgi:Type I phosphodiesterase / nucleotide pyrophosphatase
MSSFASIPGTVRTRVQAGEKVLLILLDAFGLEFLPRHQGHPLIERLTVTELRSQFPTTTTAHIPTLAFGMPVQQHGFYEWNVYEPKLDDIWCPFRWAYSREQQSETLTERLTLEEMRPGPSFAAQLGAPAASVMPEQYADSVFTRFCAEGSEVISFKKLDQGVTKSLDWMRAIDSGQGAYAFLYWDEIDTTGHVEGPGSAAFDVVSERALDQIHAALASVPDDVTVLFTADHGQVDVSPTRVDYLDQLWPALTEHLRFAHPAGSARDVFLHLRPGSTEVVLAALSARLEGRADVCVPRELIGGFEPGQAHTVGPRLEERLADLLILPVAGRQAWISTQQGPHSVFKGHHGGLTDAEAGTYLAELQR